MVQRLDYRADELEQWSGFLLFELAIDRGDYRPSAESRHCQLDPPRAGSTMNSAVCGRSSPRCWYRTCVNPKLDCQTAIQLFELRFEGHGRDQLRTGCLLPQRFLLRSRDQADLQGRCQLPVQLAFCTPRREILIFVWYLPQLELRNRPGLFVVESAPLQSLLSANLNSVIRPDVCLCHETDLTTPRAVAATFPR